MQISEGLAFLVVVFYIVPGVGWAAYWLMYWLIYRAEYWLAHGAEVRRAARMTLLTPVWPVFALFYLTRAVKELVEDAL